MPLIQNDDGSATWIPETGGSGPQPGASPAVIQQIVRAGLLGPGAGKFSPGVMTEQDMADKTPEVRAGWNTSQGMPLMVRNAVQNQMLAGDLGASDRASRMLGQLPGDLNPNLGPVQQGIAAMLGLTGQPELQRQEAKRQADEAAYHAAASKNLARAQNSSYLGVPGVGAGQIGTGDNLAPVVFGPGLASQGLAQGTPEATFRQQLLNTYGQGTSADLAKMAAAGNPVAAAALNPPIPGVGPREREQYALDAANQRQQALYNEHYVLPARIKAEEDKFKQDHMDQRNWYRIENGKRVGVSADQVARTWQTALNAHVKNGGDPDTFPGVKDWATQQGLNVSLNPPGIPDTAHGGALSVIRGLFGINPPPASGGAPAGNVGVNLKQYRSTLTAAQQASFDQMPPVKQQFMAQQHSGMGSGGGDAGGGSSGGGGSSDDGRFDRAAGELRQMSSDFAADRPFSATPTLDQILAQPVDRSLSPADQVEFGRLRAANEETRQKNLALIKQNNPHLWQRLMQLQHGSEALHGR